MYAGFKDFENWIPSDEGYRTINSMTLPAGRFVVVTKGVLGRIMAVGSSVTCRVGRGTSYDRVGLHLARHGTIHDRQPFVIVWTGSFPEARKVSFQCRSSAGSVGVNYLRMFAYKAGTLTKVSLE